MSPEAERFDAEFFRLGVQYYAAARAAARAGFIPVCGNVYHHALEMLLKGRLINTYSSKELASRSLGHRLNELWTAFKADTKAADLDQFDATIEAVNAFETLRYPDAVLMDGAQIRIDWVPWTPPVEFQKSAALAVPQYSLVISDIDRLVSKLFSVCSRNPKFFTGGLNSYATDAILFNNDACAGWFNA
jgi:hypothetical protein